MKTILISSISLVLATVYSTAQPNFLWESSYNGVIANDQANVMAVDAAGNVYVTGYTDMPNGTTDYLTIKYDPNGNILWAQTYNGPANGNDGALGIKLDASANVYVTGQSQKAGAGYNMVTIKYNSDGIQQWIAVHSGADNSINIGYNIALDIFGNVYVVGGNSTNGGVIVKYNSLGVSQWISNLLGNYQNKNLITINSNDGNIIVTGSASLNHIFYLKSIDPTNGNTIRSYNTNSNQFGVGLPNALVLDGLGNIYVTCTGDNSLGAIDPSEVETVKFTYPGTAGEAYVWKNYTYVNTSGSLLSGVDMKLDISNNVYVAMNFYDGTTFRFLIKKILSSGTTAWQNPTPGILGQPGTPVSMSLSKNSNPPDIYMAGYNALGDFKTIKYSNATGDTLWTKIYDCGNNGTDIATAMVIDNCDNIYITGTSNCNGTFKDVKTIKYGSSAVPNVTASGPTTFCQGGSVVLNASPGNSYLWSNGATSQFITVSTSGSYSVTVTNASGCQSVSDEIVVTVVPPPAAAVTPAGQVSICQGTSTTLSASQASSYLWNTGATTQNISVSTAGNYWVTVTNATGCSAVSAVTAVLVQPAPIATVTPGGSISLCQGNSTILMASAANSYLWNTGATSQNITVSSTGNYWVTVTNAAGCSAVSSATTVTVNPIPTPTITPGSLVTICQGNSVMLSSSAASSYLWSNGATTPSITVSLPGSYSVTVTNAAGCVGSSSTTTVNIESPPIATITPIGPTTFCQGGSVILTASQANAYQWNTGATTQNILVSATGVYSVTITNAAGCTASASISVNATPVATITLEPNDTTCGNTDGFIITNVAGGSPIASFLWSNGATTQIIFNLAGGTYSLTATDVNDCTVTAQATVVGRVNPTVDLGPDITINSGQQATLIPNATGSGLSYLWSTNATTPTITVTVGGSYSVTVTNSDGCTATDAVIVNVITSVVDPSGKLRITLYPNPASDVVYITCEGGATLSARVVDILGRQLLIDTTPIPDGEVRTLWLGGISAGIFFIEVIGEDFREMAPFVKQ